MVKNMTVKITKRENSEKSDKDCGQRYKFFPNCAKNQSDYRIRGYELVGKDDITTANKLTIQRYVN